jgi:hypothetical protein
MYNDTKIVSGEKYYSIIICLMNYLKSFLVVYELQYLTKGAGVLVFIIFSTSFMFS